jgi:hypothetical protein
MSHNDTIINIHTFPYCNCIEKKLKRQKMAELSHTYATQHAKTLSKLGAELENQLGELYRRHVHELRNQCTKLCEDLCSPSEEVVLQLRTLVKKLSTEVCLKMRTLSVNQIRALHDVSRALKCDECEEQCASQDNLCDEVDKLCTDAGVQNTEQKNPNALYMAKLREAHENMYAEYENMYAEYENMYTELENQVDKYDIMYAEYENMYAEYENMCVRYENRRARYKKRDEKVLEKKRRELEKKREELKMATDALDPHTRYNELCNDVNTHHAEMEKMYTEVGKLHQNLAQRFATYEAHTQHVLARTYTEFVEWYFRTKFPQQQPQPQKFDESTMPNDPQFASYEEYICALTAYLSLGQKKIRENTRKLVQCHLFV